MENTFKSVLEVVAAHKVALCERLSLYLSVLHPLLQADVVRALEEPGKLLAQPRSQHELVGFWSLLTLSIAQLIAPDIDIFQASRVAIAVEFFICAVDLLDDIEDEDQTSIVQDLGAARVLNVSTTLLMLAQKALTTLSDDGVDAEMVFRLLHVLEDAALSCAAGQHKDLLAEQYEEASMTEAMCLKIVEEKSGSLMKLPFQLGAIYAQADQSVYDQLTEFGKLLGISSQLDNDSHDLYDLLDRVKNPHRHENKLGSKESMKTDLLRKKKTMPIILAAQIERKAFADGDAKEASVLSAQREGIVATWGLSLLYRERANDCLQEVRRQFTLAPTLLHLLKL